MPVTRDRCYFGAPETIGPEGPHALHVHTVFANRVPWVREDPYDMASPLIDPQPDPQPGRLLGRVWQSGDTWAAAPRTYGGEPDDYMIAVREMRVASTLREQWSREVGRSERVFATRIEAAAWLDGFDMAIRRVLGPRSLALSLGDPWELSIEF